MSSHSLINNSSLQFSHKQDDKPTNDLVGVMLTDMYQISMTYAHWINKRHMDHAVFDLFFRKNPFGGEYCVSYYEIKKQIKVFKLKKNLIILPSFLPPSLYTITFNNRFSLDKTKSSDFYLLSGRQTSVKQN